MDLRDIIAHTIAATTGVTALPIETACAEAILALPELQWIRRQLMPPDLVQLRAVMDPQSALADDSAMPPAVRDWVLS